MYNIPLGGGLFRQPWAIGGALVFISVLNRESAQSYECSGSGSTYVYGYCDATYQDGWGRDETVNFVKNSSCFVLHLCNIVFNKVLVQPFPSQCREMVLLEVLFACA